MKNQEKIKRRKKPEIEEKKITFPIGLKKKTLKKNLRRKKYN